MKKDKNKILELHKKIPEKFFIKKFQNFKKKIISKPRKSKYKY